jgi:hypothetical protein
MTEPTPDDIRYAEVIEALHQDWTPHPGQAELGRTLFDDRAKEIMAVCGRNWGKTEFIIYALTRSALLYPGTHSYYFAPEQKQAKEILWASRRLQDFAPGFQSSTNDTEMRITYDNGSFVKCDGSDNVNQYRGVKPPPKSLFIYDEFKDFRPEFYDAMNPNLQHAHLLIFGTPPEVDNHFTQVEDEFQRDPDKRYFNFPSSSAPHNSPAWLAKKKAELYARGDGDVWEREYMARRVRGGKNSIFPMIHSFKLTPHAEVMASMRKDLKKLQWYAITDPGTTTCHATLFAALNPYTKVWYLLDEIYETRQSETSTRLIGSVIQEKLAELGQGRAEWDLVADEAAQWFITEMYDRFGDAYAYRATEKNANKKETGISLIKDALLRGKIIASDRCQKWLWEMSNYIKDDSGKIPKGNDHLIDDTRYLFAAAHYVLENESEPVPEHLLENFRGARPEDDFPELEGITSDEFLGAG